MIKFSEYDSVMYGYATSDEEDEEFTKNYKDNKSNLKLNSINIVSS